MLSIWTVGTLVALYLLLLFAIAFWGDKRLRDNQQHPILYSLGLGVHCTSWAFFGTTSQAAQYGWAIIPTYLGIMLTMAFAFPVLLHISRLCQQHNISSLADLIALKYKHSHLIAAFVTLLCFIGVIPYIALQLDAITKSINLITADTAANNAQVSVYVAGLMAVFAIIFGTRSLNLTDKHPGLLLTIAFESLVKLIALWAVGIFVCYVMFDGLFDVVTKAANHTEAAAVLKADGATGVYFSHVLLGICAMFVLPRQFQMNFVEQNGEGELRTARWLFPLYLLGMTVFLIPIALAGKLLLSPSISSDTYVIALPLYAQNPGLSSLAFLGGLSATTSMVIVATLAMGIMISNNVVTPLWLKARLKTAPNNSMAPSKILTIRRLTVFVVISIALWYHLNISQTAPLAKSGVIAIALLGQCLPILMFGLYWKKSTTSAAICALLVGLTTWFILLLYPSLLSSYYFDPVPSDYEMGVGFVSALVANCVTFVLVSLVTHKNMARTTTSRGQPTSLPQLMIKVRDLLSLTERVLENTTQLQLTQQLSVDIQRTGLTGYASQSLIERVDKLLSAQVGAPSAKILLGAIADTGNDPLPELVDWVEEASQSFQFNHEVLQSSVQNIEQGISVLDDKLQLLAWNDRYIELFNYPKGFLKAGMPIADILAFNAKRGLFNMAQSSSHNHQHNITYSAAVEGAMSDEISKRIAHITAGNRYKHIRQQNDGRVIEVNGAPLPGGGYVTTYSDITEYMSIQQALETAKTELEARVAKRTAELVEAKSQADKANESKTKFLAAAGHDLMQPFNAATLFAEMLKRKTEKTPLASLSEGVVSSLHSAQNLLSTLLDMTRLDSGHFTPQKSVFCLNDILASLTQEFSVIAHQKGLQLTYVNSSVYVYSDKHLLRRVLQNLISNAVRYTETGKVLVGVRRKVNAPSGWRDANDVSPFVTVCVYDTGMGIAPHQQEDIFAEFHQLNVSQGNEGLGLGLTIVDKICRLLDHSLSLKSTPNQGSVFCVEVERCDRPDTLAMREENQTLNVSNQVTCLKDKEASPRFLTRKQILLIENDEQVASAMKTLLTDWGALVTWIKGRDETALLRTKTFDILIADYHLQNKDTGFNVTQWLEAKGARFVQKILITANRSDTIREEAAAKQFMYLPKPVKQSALKRMLKKSRRDLLA